MLKILLLEPHGDDGICSCSSVLRSDNDIDIITLGKSRPSQGLTDFYKSVKSVEYIELDELDYYSRPKISTHDIHRRFVNEENLYQYYLDLNINTYNDEMIKCVNEISSLIYNKLKDKSYDIILTPTGIGHPYHLAVSAGTTLAYSQILKDKPGNISLILYTDKPYYQTRYCKEMNESLKNSYDLNKIISPEVDKEDEVLKVFKEVYPTELSMMRFSKDILTKDVDIFFYDSKTSQNDTINKFKKGLN